jgi:hypothetical protein
LAEIDVIQSTGFAEPAAARGPLVTLAACEPGRYVAQLLRERRQRHMEKDS